LVLFKKCILNVFFWGAGTAIGELPPYFVAKASRLSGKKLEETLDELDDDDDDEEENNNEATIMDKIKKNSY